MPVRTRTHQVRVATYITNAARQLDMRVCFLFWLHGHVYSLRGSNPRPMAHKTIALTTELREPTKCSTTRTCKPLHKKTNDPGRTRTCNRRLRVPMPYPLGHGAANKHDARMQTNASRRNTAKPTQPPTHTNFGGGNRDTQQTHAIESAAAQSKRSPLPL